MTKKTFSEHRITAAGYPATYRQREVEVIVENIRARTSLIISSLGGSGKSHLARFLVSNQAFKQYYFSDDADDFAFFLFDCNAVATDDELEVLRLMIFELGKEAGQETGEWMLSQSRTELVNALTACLNSLFRQGLTLIFVFDRMEKLLSSSYLAQTLDTFRYLRDQFARSIVYILVGRFTHGKQEIPGMSGEFDDLLANPSTLYLKPLSQSDAEHSIDLYEEENRATKVNFNTACRERLLYFSGFFPRLLRAVCEVWHKEQLDPTADEEDIIRKLLDGGRVGKVCKELWKDIPVSRQQDLRYLAAGIAANVQDSFLTQYGLVSSDKADRPQIFSPVFTEFVKQQGKADVKFELVPPNEVHINDNIIQLTPREYRFLDVLYQESDKVVPYDDIIDAVYREPEWTAASLAGIAKLVRKKINVIPNHDFIVNVRAVGYRLNLVPDRA